MISHVIELLGNTDHLVFSCSVKLAHNFELLKLTLVSISRFSVGLAFYVSFGHRIL